MLIVIVIIGILIAAIYPRLSNARGRANDVARKADLAQVAAALVAFQIDHGRFPAPTWPLNNTTIRDNLISAGMSSIPEDPNSTREFLWIWSSLISSGQYGYTPIKKWWISGNGFVVMAAAETEWGANWVVTSTTWTITSWTNYQDINLCKTFITSCATPGTNVGGECCYDEDLDQLRYIYLY